jgi:hypothetical protein
MMAVNPKPPKKRRTRRTRQESAPHISVRLSLSDDPDLIAWWQSQPAGQAAKVVKTAIRDYLAALSDSDPARRADLVEFSDSLAGQTASIQTAIAALAEGQAAILRQLASGVYSIQPGNAQPPEGSASEPERPKLTPQEIATRQKALLKTKW